MLYDIEIDTTNNYVYRKMTVIEINFRDDQEVYIGDWKISPCLLNPPYLLNLVMQTHFLGVHVKNNYYIATTPDETGRLYI